MEKDNRTREELLNSYDHEKKEKDQKEKRKKGAIALAALILAALIGLGAYLAACSKKKNDDTKSTDTTIETETEEPKRVIKIEKFDLSKLGKDLDIPDEKEILLEQFGEVVSFNGESIDVEKITEAVDPTTNEKVLFVDKEAADNASEIGKVTYDTQTDEYVDSQGNVRKNESGYEVVDPKTGNVETGNGDIPSGYVEKTDDNGQTIYVESDKADTYFFADKDYWTFDENGNPYIIFKKGDRIDKQEFELLKDILFDYKPSKSENNSDTVETSYETGEPIYETEPVQAPAPITSSTYTEVGTPDPKPTTTVDEYGGIVNADGTYTIFDLIFESKADYQQWVLQGYEGYALVDGIMMSEEAMYEYEKTLNP